MSPPLLVSDCIQVGRAPHAVNDLDLAHAAQVDDPAADPVFEIRSQVGAVVCKGGDLRLGGRMLREVNAAQFDRPANVLRNWLPCMLSCLETVSPDERTVVSDDAFECLEGQVQTIERRIAALQSLDDRDRLSVMVEASEVSERFRQLILSAMPERRMPEVVAARNQIRKRFVEMQPRCDISRDLSDL
jgi:hypothetical protein